MIVSVQENHSCFSLVKLVEVLDKSDVTHAMEVEILSVRPAKDIYIPKIAGFAEDMV